MFESMKKDKVKMITLIGMAVMIVAVAVKVATASLIAAAAIHIAGLACFFLIEGIEKTPDSESGLSFKRFFPDLKKGYQRRRQRDQYKTIHQPQSCVQR